MTSLALQASTSTAFAVRAQRPRAPRRVLATRALFGGGGDGQGGGNPFGNMGNLMENLKKAQQMVQVEAAKVQEELAVTEFDGYSGDETVRVVMSGNQEPRSVEITQEAYEQGVDKLNQLVAEAMRDAHGKSVEGMKLRMRSLAANLGMPAQLQ
ncbi:Nucleoid-associated chloroplastic [Micractinium conductrix]|uniref:Nucleoid-associated chloroplastic n=1 Tax=Micractinium conductrix TaxID=554055 RepID=A0A2P6VQE5_9CHLO|nr:Nucleoid-associated chloroplastic [Micractinium conductrix]|eukprot:PSC76287.1 Nucleoid-associated chloroplastic [Micractinium conductrix]